jgi:hypothetical protein
MPQSKPFLILAAISLFLLTSGISYWLFNYLKVSKSFTSNSPPITATSSTKKSKIDPSIPRTEVCPLNGALFTKQERDVWETRRPLGIMIENSVDARPQSGLSTADIVYEAVAEGGITRFMGIFYCNAALSGNIMIAPVRSARIYFVNLIAEYDGLYNHVGGAGNCDDINVDPRAKALCAIRKNNIKDLDQFGLDFKTCHRVTNRLDKDVAYEHTMACFLEEIYKAGADRGWTNVDAKGVAWNKNFTPWQFKSPTDKSTGDPATSVSYYFWGHDKGVGEEFNKAFDVSWAYDPTTGNYTRSNASQVSLDLNTAEPLKFTTVIVQYAKETSAGDLEKHMLYENIGSGKALVFTNGVAVKANWSKPSLKARTIFTDAKGVQIKFNPGPIWISILPIGNTVTFN